MRDGFKDYWISKLLFPKTYIIDKPGIIISKTSSKYSNKEVKRRMIYDFEDIAANLQLKASKNLGQSEADRLFYKIGKDVAVRYMLLSKAKKSPSFLQNSLINYLFDNLKGGGFSLAENVTYNVKEMSLILKGKSNMICRKSKLSSFTSGLISGFVSFLTGENIEAESKCYDCPNNCIVIANKSIEERYIPDTQKLMPMENYNILNFPKFLMESEKYHTFNDLIKFGKVKVGSGKILFMGKALIPIEAGCLELVADYFVRINKKDLLVNALTESSEKLAEEFLKDKETISNKVKAIKIMLSAFGWGLADLKKYKKKIFFDFINAPINKYGFLYRASVVNGYINNIFNNNFRIERIDYPQNSNVKIVYSVS
ncbi:hypothetical protein A3K73_05530 [Candidatus Pacearchaeota archaeon RBG_13_36_9]|nr:MAG: hypothetical protein A3K73_05530 [Candidatus Pacearchaeota archaeon RBG_13_36_9]HJX50130.1 hypothetical protein [Candidatus Nanoarchaeia archaeon]